jgi:hypothetical protein
VVLRHIENELRTAAASNPQYAIDLADTLWEEGALETRLLAADLLGRIPPMEEHLLPRITAWTQQIRDPEVRSALLTTSLTRMRKENPKQFLALIRELLHPARARTWSNGLQALLPMITDTTFENFPPILDVVEPIIQAAPSTLQTDLKDLIIELYKASPSETAFFLKQILSKSDNPMTAITLRRISSSFQTSLQIELKDYLRVTPISQTVRGMVEAIEVGSPEREDMESNLKHVTEKTIKAARKPGKSKTGIKPISDPNQTTKSKPKVI